MRNIYLLALLSAFLLWLSWPPIPYTGPLLAIALVPLLIAVEKIMRGPYSHKGRKIFSVAFTTGFLWNTASIYWVYHAMNAFLPSFAAVLIALIPFALAPVLMGLAFRLYYEMRKRYNIMFSFVGLISFWIAYEYLHQSWSLSFPWMTLGNGLADSHQLIQWYSVTGVYGGSLWIWMLNMIFFLWCWQRLEKVEVYPSYKLLLTGAGTLIIPIAVSLWQYTSYEEHVNPSEVVVVQPNIDPYGKFGAIPPDEQLANLISLSESVAQPNTEFFIWPETAISARGGIDEASYREHPSYLKIVAFLQHYKNGNVLSGIESFGLYQQQQTLTAREISPQVYQDNFNAAVLIDDRSNPEFYHKSKLVPGAEQMPFGKALSFMKPLFKHFGGTTGGYGSQEEPSVFYSASGIGAAPVICYESIWGDYVGKYIQQGAQFIAIVTNDGWWGDTSGKDQHLAYAKLRAIENRRWVARSANTGISAFINQRGDIVQQSGWWEATALRQEINLNEEITFYTASGDLVAYAALLSALLSTAALLKRRRK